MDILMTIVLGIVSSLLAVEFYDRARNIAKWLIDRSSLKLPHPHRDRFNEEWLAHLDNCSSRFEMLFHAFGCSMGAGAVAEALTKADALIDEIEPFDATFALPNRLAKLVLIVEDNELQRKIFHDFLNFHGYLTISTSYGTEAFRLARRYQPDLIIMDIQLPEVSGIDVTRWIKDDQQLMSIPVMAVTAFAAKGDEERFRQCGCDAYLSKPISVGKFLAVVGKLAGQFGGSSLN